MSKRLFKKAFRDLFSDKRKAVSSLLAIIIGMLSFGALLFSHEIIINELVTTYSSINAPSASVTVDRVDEQLISLTEGFSEIADFEVKTKYEMRGQKENGEWTTLELFAAEDYSSVAINKTFYIAGAETPGMGEMLIERDAINVAGKGLGDTLSVTLPDGSAKNIQITGVINDLGVHPATMHNTIYAYVSMDTLKELGFLPNKVDFIISGNAYDRDSIMTVGNEYVRMLEQNGYQIKGLSVENTPGISMHLEEYKTALFLLRAFAIVVFLFSCLIMSSLITSILTKQVKQIGILKTFGTKSGSILCSYLLALLSVIGVIGIIALPLSKLLANCLSAPLLRISNMNLTNTEIETFWYALFLIVCLSIPLIITFFSVNRATRITVKQAINHAEMAETGISKPIISISFCQRPVMLTLRNAFRKKGRFCLNVFTLAISGLCFITVFVSMVSVSTTLSHNLNTAKYDYRFIANETEETQLSQILNNTADIGSYEYWGYTSGKFVYENGEIGNSYPVYSVPENSQFITPDLSAGNWLSESAVNDIVVGHELLRDHPELQVGSMLTLNLAGYTHSFRITGVIQDFSGSNIYMSESYYLKNISATNRQEMAQVQIDSNLRGKSRTNLIQKMEESLLNQGVSILQSQTKANAIKVLNSHYMATFQTFLIIIFMVLIVSAFGLASTTNIQTMERMREIGIMKAMGADKKQIVKIITSESVFIGLTGWLFASLLAIPGIAVGLSYFSATTLETSISLNLSAVISSYIIWLILILLIGKQASKRTALRAANMTIKNSLLLD